MADYFETYKRRMEASRPPFEKMIDEDIKKCDEFIKSNIDEETGKALHLELTSKYNDYIANLGNGLYGYISEQKFFELDYIGGESLKHNISVIMYKLIAYKNNGYRNSNISSKKGVQIVNTNENTLTANQTITITFEEAKKAISEMTGLSENDTNEALVKIDEIKTIVELKESPKTKWQKVKPILAWIADKSVDVGIALLPLILKIGG